MAVAMPVRKSEAVGEVGGDVVFAAGDVDLDGACLAEGDNAGIEPVYQRTEGQEVQLMRPGLEGQTVHVCTPLSLLGEGPEVKALGKRKQSEGSLDQPPPSP